jgi:hypothetical protein
MPIEAAFRSMPIEAAFLVGFFSRHCPLPYEGEAVTEAAGSAD